jgi:hypothetical protein
MSTQRDSEPRMNEGKSILQNERVRKVILYAAILLFVFLIGLVPMWITSRARAHERDAALATLRISMLQNALGNAAIDARRGEYEVARQAASDFFTNLQAEIDRGRDSVFTETQRSNLRALFDSRDDAITLLARSDPASADRLLVLYVKYRQALGTAIP